MSGLPSKLARANPDDADAIRELVRAAYAKWVPVIGREPRPMIADYAEKLGTFRFDLLRLGGELVGLIETQSRNDHYWIENVAVHPDRQGEGHGSRLMAHAEALATTAGQSDVRLLTNAAFTTNIALYERLGYRTTHTEPFGNGMTVYLSKTL